MTTRSVVWLMLAIGVYSLLPSSVLAGSGPDAGAFIISISKPVARLAPLAVAGPAEIVPGDDQGQIGGGGRGGGT